MRERKSAGLVRPGMWMIVKANSPMVSSHGAWWWLPVQPLEAGVVRVKLKWFVQEIRGESVQKDHHGQELETVGGVAAFWDGEFARFIGHLVPGPLVVGLFQNGAHGQLGGICDEPRSP